MNRANYWSTLDLASNLSELDTCAKCDLGLIHLGSHKYALIECKPDYTIYDTVEKIQEFFNRRHTNAKRKLEHDQKLSECVVHQNRSKRQKRDVNYLELNIGKSAPQPKSKSKSKTKKIDIVAALREPSETRLAAYQIQKERQHINPGDVIGTIIKTKIKSEVKIELDRINTRHKYKNTKFPTNVNYIHADGTPCKSAKRKANELPDLPPVEVSPRTTNTTGLAVETLSRIPVDMTSEDTVNDEVNNSNKPDQNTTDGLPTETEHQKDINKLPPSDETNSVTECEMDQNAGLTVE